MEKCKRKHGSGNGRWGPAGQFLGQMEIAPLPKQRASEEKGCLCLGAEGWRKCRCPERALPPLYTWENQASKGMQELVAKLAEPSHHTGHRASCRGLHKQWLI